MGQNSYQKNKRAIPELSGWLIKKYHDCQTVLNQKTSAVFRGVSPSPCKRTGGGSGKILYGVKKIRCPNPLLTDVRKATNIFFCWRNQRIIFMMQRRLKNQWLEFGMNLMVAI